MMNRAKLYNSVNDIQISHARELIKKYGKTMQQGWNVNTRVLDVGCGDGAVTKLLTTHLSRAQWSACDISLDMINFAKKTCGGIGVEFFQMDLRDKIKEELRASFDCVFCLFVLHRIHNHSIAFSNLHSLLKAKGRCLVSIMGDNDMYDVERRMARNSKWSPYIKDVEQLISPYHGVENPQKSLKTVMSECGFKDVDVAIKNFVWPFNDLGIYRNLVKSVNSCLSEIPLQLHEEYLEEYFELLAEDKEELSPFYLKFSVLEAIAKK